MYSVKLEVFEGPFDLLYHLIEKNEIDIYDIPIARITEEYLEHIRAMQVLDLYLAGEFLVLAATLVELKAKTLIPRPVTEPLDEDGSYDLREELVSRLLEYKRFKNVSEELRTRELDERRIYHRLVDEVVEYIRRPDLNDTMPVEKLWEALIEVLSRREIEEEESGDVLEIGPEEFSVEDKMEHIQRAVEQHTRLDFRQLFRRRAHKLEIIVTFLALLELVRLNKVRVTQEATFGRISIYSFGLESVLSEA